MLNSNNHPRILIVGSEHKASLESIYFRALSKIGVLNLTFFNTDQLSPLVAKPQMPYRLLRYALSFLAARKTEQTFQQVLDKERRKYDAIILFKGMAFSRRTLEASRQFQANAIWININPDDPFNIQSRGSTNTNVIESISFFDIYCTWSQSLVPKIQAKGVKRVEYLPFGYDPELHNIGKLPPAINSNQVAFIGTWDKRREAILSELTHYPLQVGGTNWNRLSNSSPLRKSLIASEAIYGAQLMKITSEAGVNLNLLRPQNLGAHNMRTFEIPAMGGLMLTTRTEEQQAWFPEGIASLMFETVDELKEKIDIALAKPTLAQQIRVTGYRLVQNHSYTARARQLLSLLA